MVASRVESPQAGRAVYHRVRRQIYVGQNPQCTHPDFVERLPGFAEDDGRGRPQSRGASVSNDSLARYVKSAAAKPIDANLARNNVRVLAVDDINLRKGDKFGACTVFLDEETHRVLIIVRGTTKAVIQRVLESFPAAAFFSRDRATAYASAAAEAGKTQIADRFHWIHHAQQAVDEALATILPATIFLRSGGGWAILSG